MTAALVEPAPAHAPTRRELLAAAARIAGLALAAIAAVAAAVTVLAAPAARAWLDYRFTGLPANVGEVLSILAHNARLLGAPIGLLLIAQATLHSGRQARFLCALRTAGESLLAGAIAANVLVLGAALGAYGPRMARALLPHGPVELAAFALALALYTTGRHARLTLRDAGAVAAVSVGLLAVAAALEVFVP